VSVLIFRRGAELVALRGVRFCSLFHGLPDVWGFAVSDFAASRGSDPNGTRLSVNPIRKMSCVGTVVYKNNQCTHAVIKSVAKTS
jgi:hypothetical protein